SAAQQAPTAARFLALSEPAPTRCSAVPAICLQAQGQSAAGMGPCAVALLQLLQLSVASRPEVFDIQRPAPRPTTDLHRCPPDRSSPSVHTGDTARAHAGTGDQPADVRPVLGWTDAADARNPLSWLQA